MTSSRVHQRYVVAVEVQIRADERLVPARTKNMSRGGLCFEIDHALPLDRPVQMRLALLFDENTLSEPLDVSARVVWSTQLGKNRYQIGTSFVGMTNETRTYLDMFLRYLKEGLELQAGEPESSKACPSTLDDRFGR